MASNDLTVIFLTANKVPKKWAQFQKEKLLEAAGNYPIITMSKEPLDWGINVLQTGDYGVSNIYFQLLKGAKTATTDYIAVAEDDILYPKEHFQHRPPEDSFAYNQNRFNIFTWGQPTFFWKNRMTNSTLIAPRKLVIEALEERFKKYPIDTSTAIIGELGRAFVENKFGLTPRKSVWFATEISIISIDHEYGIDHLAVTHRKRKGILQAYDIPYWGRAEDIIKQFI